MKITIAMTLFLALLAVYAAHLIRLLRMGIEFLRDGEMRVDRGGLDATELLDIKHGTWTLEQVQAAEPTLDFDGIYGADGGRKFTEIVYRELTRKPGPK